MHIDWSQVGALLGHGAGYIAALLLCLAGLVLSALTFSGTWFVLGAALLLAWLRGPGFPGAATLIVFLLLCIAIEVAEWLAGAWGVQKRGGSKLAGVAAMFGGLLGLLLGSFIPIFVIGPLLGLLAGSFAGAYLVERHRLQAHAGALHIATGAILARIAMLLVKITVTLGLVVFLLLGLVFA